jgi:predicted permease
MKQKDIALIIVVVFISAIMSFFVSQWLFAPPKARQQEVEVVGPISSSFTIPSSTYFNTNSVDPTQLIQIGNTANPNPFNNGQ